MKPHDGHVRYKRRIYRKNRIKLIIIIAAVCIVAAALLFLIIGNILGSRVSENIGNRDSQTTQVPEPSHSEVRSVSATPVTLGGKLSSKVGDVCFYLEGSGGEVLYSSALSTDSSSQGLGRFADTIHTRGGYAIGIIRLSKFATDDDLARASAAGYYAALTAESLRAGVDDVLLHASSVPAERIEELVGIANEVRRLCPDYGTLGISVSPSLFTGENASDSFDSLWAAFDYVAIDATAAPAEGVSASEQVSTVLGNSLYYLLRYNLRVLLPSTDDTTLSAMIASANASGSQNIQVMP